MSTKELSRSPPSDLIASQVSQAPNYCTQEFNEVQLLMLQGSYNVAESTHPHKQTIY